jgi:hypothetical protein
MTRFETINGIKLGVRFAGDLGVTFHLTNEEKNNLFNLPEDTEVVSDNSWFGNVGDLLDIWNKGNKVTSEELMRRFKKELNESLHFNVVKKLFVNKKGQIVKIQFIKK